MTLNNPKLELIFLADDLEKGHSTRQIVNAGNIVMHSISIDQELLSGLKPASDKLHIQIRNGTPSIEDIIATNGDIKAVLYDGIEPLFTGYLTTNYDWNLSETGEEVLDLTLEDVGTRLLGKPFRRTGKHLFNCTADKAIRDICQTAGIRVSDNCKVLDAMITATVDSNKTCKDLLTDILYELGYVYFFDSIGELCLYEINCISTAGIPILNSSNLCTVGGDAISLKKNIRQYRSARITYSTLSTASNYLVYRNTSGKDIGHPYCNLQLSPGEHFDGIEMYTPAEWSEAQAETLREPALLEACNASSETDIVGGRKIIAISNVKEIISSTSGYIQCSITEAGGPYLKIHATNKGSIPYNILQMDAYADIIYAKDTNIVRTNTDVIDPEMSDNVINEEMEYIHDRELAQRHANLITSYYRYCNAKYTFFSKENLTAGSLVKISDDLFTGLVVNVLITRKTSTDQSSINEYEAVAISTFNLDADAHFQSIGKGQNDTVGQDGINVATLQLYARSESTPSNVSFDVYYNFLNHKMEGIEEPWHTTIPELTSEKDKIWISTSTASTRVTSDVILPDEWSVPVVFTQNGESAKSLVATASNTQIEFYADDVPIDPSTSIEIQVKSSNLSGIINVSWLSNTRTITGSEGSAFIPATDFIGRSCITVDVTCSTFHQAITISKTKQTGYLELSLSDNIIEYYYDEVPVNSGVIATVHCKGLSKVPTEITAGKTTLQLENSSVLIPSTLFQNTRQIDVSVKAVGGFSDTKTLTKKTRDLVLGLGFSSYTFHYDKDGNNPVPSSIIVTNQTYGLSNPYKAILRLGLDIKSFDENKKFILHPNDVPGNHAVISLSYGEEEISQIIVKSHDGKTGPQGIAGPKGETGEKGVSGPAGADGKDGIDGKDGVTGPQGPKGEPGPQGETGPKGETGSEGPAGPQGPRGDQGIPGPTGADGQTYYLHIAYANSSNGVTDFTTDDSKSSDKKYIGQYVNTNETDSQTPSDYHWSKIKGEDGLNGKDGAPGKDGIDGKDGAPGKDGINGKDGTPGKDGINGKDGAPGKDGTNGKDGARGPQGGGDYCGPSKTAPTTKPNGNALEDGDFYLNINDQTQPIPYIRKNDQWAAVSTSDKNWSQIAGATIDDVGKLGGNLSSTSAYYASYQNLAAKKAFIENIAAQIIELNHNGVIKSTGFEPGQNILGFQIGADGKCYFYDAELSGNFRSNPSWDTHVEINKKQEWTEVAIASQDSSTPVPFNGLIYSKGPNAGKSVEPLKSFNFDANLNSLTETDQGFKYIEIVKDEQGSSHQEEGVIYFNHLSVESNGKDIKLIDALNRESYSTKNKQYLSYSISCANGYPLGFYAKSLTLDDSIGSKTRPVEFIYDSNFYVTTIEPLIYITGKNKSQIGSSSTPFFLAYINNITSSLIQTDSITCANLNGISPSTFIQNTSGLHDFAGALQFEGTSQSWVNGRDSAKLKFKDAGNGYNPAISFKAHDYRSNYYDGSWDMGYYGSSNASFFLTFINDNDYNHGVNTMECQYTFERNGTFRANNVWGAVANDYADSIEVNSDCIIEAGRCYCTDGTAYHKSSKYLEKGCIGIHSDTYAFNTGKKGNGKELDIAVSGFVLAYVDKDYPTGTPLTCGKNGTLTKIKWWDRILHPDMIIATYWKNETLETWEPDSKAIKVNGRKWVKIK